MRQDSLNADNPNGAHVPLDLSPNTRDRARAGVDPLINTLLHMQYPADANAYPSGTAVRTPGAWDIALPDGTYSVTAGVGDQKSAKYGYDSLHTLHAGGVTLIDRFQGTDAAPFGQGTAVVPVSGQRMTLDAQSGVNTKVNYVTATPLSIPLPAGYCHVQWTTAAPAPIRHLEAQRAVIGGKLYAFGGYYDSSTTPGLRVDVYDPAADTWTRSADLPEPFTHAGTVTVGTHVYMAGGYLGPRGGPYQIFGSTHVWDFDAATQTYSRLPDLPEARAAGALVELNGVLHFFGGADINRVDAGTHWTLPLTGKAAAWTLAAPLNDPRNHLGGVVLNGRIYCVGGEHGQNEAEYPSGTTEVWDAARPDGWQFLCGMPRARSHIAGATFVQNGRIIVMGGEYVFRQSVADMTAYDPLSNTWTTLSPLPAARNSGVGASIGGKLYYNGKCSCSVAGATTTYCGTPD